MRIYCITIALLLCGSWCCVAQQQILIGSTNIKIEGSSVGECTLYAQDKSIFGNTKNYISMEGDVVTVTQIKYVGKNLEPVLADIYKFSSQKVLDALSIDKSVVKDRFVPSEEAFEVKLTSIEPNIQQTHFESGVSNPVAQNTNSVKLTFDMELLADKLIETLKGSAKK